MTCQHRHHDAFAFVPEIVNDLGAREAPFAGELESRQALFEIVRALQIRTPSIAWRIVTPCFVIPDQDSHRFLHVAFLNSHEWLRPVERETGQSHLRHRAIFADLRAGIFPWGIHPI
jgi:hypothetical protein